MANLIAVLLAVFLYFVGPFILAALCLPWLLNAFNGSGYWYNALTLIGLEKRLKMRKQANWHQERGIWENRRYWDDVNRK